jgi:2'-5' RNA ligase
VVNAADYDRFSVVIYAPPAVRDEVEAIRRTAPPCGRPMMEAHITVKGSFVQPTDLDLIAERTRQCCAAAQPFAVTANHWHFSGDEEQAIITLRVENSEPLDAFHWQLVREIKDLCVTDYFGEDIGVFRPHITLVQAFPTDETAWALAVVKRFRPRYAFEATEAALCGRRGGQVWEPLAVFPLGEPARD